MDARSTTAEVNLQPEGLSWPLRHHRIRVPPSTADTPVSRLAKTLSDFSWIAGEGNVPSLACLLNVLIEKLLLTYYLNLSRCLDIYASYNTQEMKKIKHYFLLLLAKVETHLNIWTEMKPQNVWVSS